VPEPEKEYYRAGAVLITNTRAELGGCTFAMANITAVSMAPAPNAAGCGCLAALLVGGGFIAVIGLLAINSDIGVHMLLVGLMMAIIGGVGWAIMVPSYTVNISSASGESRAMQSNDKAEIERIVGAIKQAIIERG
jgi:Family of unknown function (DUF6232)